MGDIEPGKVSPHGLQHDTLNLRLDRLDEQMEAANAQHIELVQKIKALEEKHGALYQHFTQAFDMLADRIASSRLEPRPLEPLPPGPRSVTSADLENWFRYHAPTSAQVVQYEYLRNAARDFAAIVLANTPPGPDQTTAIRKIREAVMTANAAVACAPPAEPPRGVKTQERKRHGDSRTCREGGCNDCKEEAAAAVRPPYIGRQAKTMEKLKGTKVVGSFLGSDPT